MFVGLRDLWFARGRFALMTTVVALVALLVVMLSGLTAGLGAENTSAIAGLDATHIVLQDTSDGPSFEQSRFGAAAVDAWASRPRVAAAAPLGISRANLTTGDTDIGVVLFGVDPADAAAPASLDHDTTVVVPRSLADDHDLAVGDHVAIGDTALTVAGTTDDASFSHSPVVWVDLSDWNRLAGAHGAVTAIALDAPDGLDGVAPVAGTTVQSVGDSFSAIGSYAEENGSLQMIRGFLLVISALVIGAFFTVWTMQRRHDIAILKAMGASTRYLLGDALGQAVIVLTTAAVVGGGIGYGIGRLVSSTVPFVSTATTTVAPLLALVVIGLLGAVVAVRSITTVDPLTALGANR
ncbi:ABC transporter permease [Euzebya sp.]|uniref:ABC transporter permease n=1 Tax=Euzebya sp. TaxID=1971409 RepID=UPI0035120B8A